jgi:predicted amidohydrolase YtcJ
MEIIDGMGLQAFTHSIGDAGIRRTLNSYERVRQINGEKSVRHVVIHCEFPAREDIARMARLGVPAGMEPSLFYVDGVIEQAMGLQRLQGYCPWTSLDKAGVRIAFGSDYPAPNNPVYGLLVAVNRLNAKGDTEWGPDEVIDIETAIRHWTIDSAYVRFLDKELGSIETGKLADMVLMDTRLLELNTLGFLLTHEVEVGKLDDFALMTFVDGKVVYQRPGFEPQTVGET